jgi:CHAT domain-containing protein
MEPLPMTISAARQLVLGSLGEESFRSTLLQNPELLRSLDPLIAPLSYLTKREDLVIFSPTGPLHAIPLHALHLAEEPLLVRNPVAYCPSLSILRHCLTRVESTRLHTAAILGDPSGDLPFAASLVGEVAGMFSTEPVQGSAVTRQIFRDAVAVDDLVHFQGHARHNAADPLKSMLVFADASLTAGEIFDIPSMRVELVTLAACESAANVIATGDEPLGLIPALLYAGANAVLATLWRVHQQSAALTMRYFYQELRQSEGKLSKVDALREAALAVRATPGFEAEYHWAPFVLNGNWR